MAASRCGVCDGVPENSCQKDAFKLTWLATHSHIVQVCGGIMTYVLAMLAGDVLGQL